MCCLWAMEEKERNPSLVDWGRQWKGNIGRAPKAPSAIAQATNSPLLAAPSPDLVHILPTPVAHSTPETPIAKVIPSALPVQYFRKLVVYVQTFATTSQTLAAAHIACTANGRYRNHLGSNLEHLDLINYTSSTSFDSLQRLEKLVFRGGGGLSLSHFCFDFFGVILFYFILIYLVFLFRFPLILI